MSFFVTLYSRAYQRGLQFGSYFLPWPKPALLQGENSLEQLPAFIRGKNIRRLLLIVDKGVASLGLADGLLAGLDREGISYVVDDGTVPNPTIGNIEEAFGLYGANCCEAIIALGGGSVMDCAKGVGARAARPKKSIRQMQGLLGVRREIPPLFAIPTTAGTGSEATLAAVISDPESHEKFQVDDNVLIPRYAVLDPLLTVGLPKQITSTTGMDALTHAVEAYIGKSNTQETRQMAKQATKLIFENLFTAYSDGTNLQARENMLNASFYAGVAFTRAYVGNVHALAHTLGGFYGTPHGLANAVLLAPVLEAYGKPAHRRLAELADEAGLSAAGDSHAQKAGKFITAIRDLNRRMDIPETLEIKPDDIPKMAERAWKEAVPLYPVPKILLKNDLEALYQRVCL